VNGSRAARYRPTLQMEIQFIKSPIGFGLGYHIGELATINENQANELVELGFAVKIEKAVKVEVKTIKKAVK
jgi:hypothetical protein